MRAVGGTASSRCVASARSSIEASSTTSASMASGCAASCAKPAGVTPSRRCTVDDVVGILSRSAGGRCCARWRMASVMRAAALPVGAASAMRQSGASASRQASRLTTVVVLPVPGPPLITVSRPRSASAAASCCQSAAPPRRAALPANSSARRARSSGEPVDARARLRARVTRLREPAREPAFVVEVAVQVEAVVRVEDQRQRAGCFGRADDARGEQRGAPAGDVQADGRVVVARGAGERAPAAGRRGLR